MLSNLSFGRSRFILNQSYTLPVIIPQSCENAVIFSLKTNKFFDTKVFLWNAKKRGFILNILFFGNEIDNVFERVVKSRIYNSEFSEIYCFTLKNSFLEGFNTIIEAIVHSRLLLELVVEEANKTKISQMNYLTTYEYLKNIKIYELLLLDSE